MTRKEFIADYISDDKEADPELPEKAANYIYSLLELGEFLAEKHLLAEAFKRVPEFEDTFYLIKKYISLKKEEQALLLEQAQAEFYLEEKRKGYDDEDEDEEDEGGIGI